MQGKRHSVDDFHPGVVRGLRSDGQYEIALYFGGDHPDVYIVPEHRLRSCKAGETCG